VLTMAMALGARTDLLDEAWGCRVRRRTSACPR
jgi:hypothetical protein